MNDNDKNTEDGVVKTTGSRFYEMLVQLGIPGVITAALLGALYAVAVALGII